MSCGVIVTQPALRQSCFNRYMSGEQGGTDNAYVDQITLIKSLPQQELVELDAQLFPPPPTEPRGWAAFVRRERIHRETALEVELGKNGPGFPECPDYDTQLDPAAYLESARALMLSANLTHFDYRDSRMSVARNVAYDQASSYLTNHPDWRDFELSRDNAKAFLGKNLLYITSVARGVADRDYYAERSRVLTAYLPELVWIDKESIKLAIDAGQIRRSQVEAARQALREIPYRAPIADFFSIGLQGSIEHTRELRAEIIDRVGQEWFELCALMQSADPKLLRIGGNRTGALGYLSVHELSMSINVNNANPLVRSVDICKAFLRSPRSFRQKLEELQSRAQGHVETNIGGADDPGIVDLEGMQIPNLDAE
jgi:hypothetical protein